MADESSLDESAAHTDRLLEEGWTALEQGRVDDARRAAEAVLVGDPAAPDALLLSAACDREDGDDDGARETLERAAAADPDWSTPELWIGELLARDPERLDEALRHARRALDLAEEEDDFLAALALKADLELELDRPTEARQTLRGLPPPELPLGDPFMTIDLAHLLIEAGAADEARVRLERLVAAEPELADAWHMLGQACETLGDEDGKRAAWIKTRELDLAATDPVEAVDVSADPSPSLTEDELVAIAEEALQGIPDELRGLLKDVPIVVAEVPAAADVAVGLDPRLLGLFHGTPHADRGGFGEPPVLTEIVLFRRNLERTAAMAVPGGSNEERQEILRDEVRTTMLHEAGHFFGLDEEALARMGLD